MSDDQRRILIVADNAKLAHSLAASLGDSYDIAVVRTFGEARELLGTGPDLLVTELKLRDYNGLHLALYAQNDGTPCAVIGERDPVLEADASEIGAVYVRMTADGVLTEDIVPLARRLLAQGAPSRHDSPVALRPPHAFAPWDSDHAVWTMYRERRAPYLH